MALGKSNATNRNRTLRQEGPHNKISTFLNMPFRGFRGRVRIPAGKSIDQILVLLRLIAMDVEH